MSSVNCTSTPSPPPCPDLREICEVCTAGGPLEWRIVVSGVVAGALSVAAVRLWQKCTDTKDGKRSHHHEYEKKRRALRGAMSNNRAKHPEVPKIPKKIPIPVQSRKISSDLGSSERDSGGSSKDQQKVATRHQGSPARPMPGDRTPIERARDVEPDLGDKDVMELFSSKHRYSFPDIAKGYQEPVGGGSPGRGGYPTHKELPSPILKKSPVEETPPPPLPDALFGEASAGSSPRIDKGLSKMSVPSPSMTDAGVSIFSPSKADAATTRTPLRRTDVPLATTPIEMKDAGSAKSVPMKERGVAQDYPFEQDVGTSRIHLPVDHTGTMFDTPYQKDAGTAKSHPLMDDVSVAKTPQYQDFGATQKVPVEEQGIETKPYQQEVGVERYMPSAHDIAISPPPYQTEAGTRMPPLILGDHGVQQSPFQRDMGTRQMPPPSAEDRGVPASPWRRDMGTKQMPPPSLADQGMPTSPWQTEIGTTKMPPPTVDERGVPGSPWQKETGTKQMPPPPVREWGMNASPWQKDTGTKQMPAPPIRDWGVPASPWQQEAGTKGMPPQPPFEDIGLPATPFRQDMGTAKMPPLPPFEDIGLPMTPFRQDIGTTRMPQPVYGDRAVAASPFRQEVGVPRMPPPPYHDQGTYQTPYQRETGTYRNQPPVGEIGITPEGPYQVDAQTWQAPPSAMEMGTGGDYPYQREVGTSRMAPPMRTMGIEHNIPYQKEAGTSRMLPPMKDQAVAQDRPFVKEAGVARLSPLQVDVYTSKPPSPMHMDATVSPKLREALGSRSFSTMVDMPEKASTLVEALPPQPKVSHTFAGPDKTFQAEAATVVDIIKGLPKETETLLPPTAAMAVSTDPQKRATQGTKTVSPKMAELGMGTDPVKKVSEETDARGPGMSDIALKTESPIRGMMAVGTESPLRITRESYTDVPPVKDTKGTVWPEMTSNAAATDIQRRLSHVATEPEPRIAIAMETDKISKHAASMATDPHMHMKTESTLTEESTRRSTQVGPEMALSMISTKAGGSPQDIGLEAPKSIPPSAIERISTLAGKSPQHIGLDADTFELASALVGRSPEDKAISAMKRVSSSDTDAIDSALLVSIDEFDKTAAEKEVQVMPEGNEEGVQVGQPGEEQGVQVEQEEPDATEAVSIAPFDELDKVVVDEEVQAVAEGDEASVQVGQEMDEEGAQVEQADAEPGEADEKEGPKTEETTDKEESTHEAAQEEDEATEKGIDNGDQDYEELDEEGDTELVPDGEGDDDQDGDPCEYAICEHVTEYIENPCDEMAILQRSITAQNPCGLPIAPLICQPSAPYCQKGEEQKMASVAPARGTGASTRPSYSYQAKTSQRTSEQVKKSSVRTSVRKSPDDSAATNEEETVRQEQQEEEVIEVADEEQVQQRRSTAKGQQRTSIAMTEEERQSIADEAYAMSQVQADGTVVVFVHSNDGREPLLVRTSGMCPCPQCLPRPPKPQKSFWDSIMDTFWPIDAPPEVGCAGKTGFATAALTCCQAASALALGMSFAEIGCCYERFILVDKRLDGTTVRSLKKYFTVIPMNVNECNPYEFSHASAVAFLWSLCEFKTLVYLDPSTKVVSREVEDLLEIRSLTVNSVLSEKLSPCQECQIIILQPSMTRYEALRTAIDRQAEEAGDCGKVNLCDAIKDAFGEPNHLPWLPQRVVVKETQLI